MAKYLGIQVTTGANIFRRHEQSLPAKLKTQLSLTNTCASKLVQSVDYGSLIWKIYAILMALYAVELLMVSTNLVNKLQKIQNCIL